MVQSARAQGFGCHLACAFPQKTPGGFGHGALKFLLSNLLGNLVEPHVTRLDEVPPAKPFAFECCLRRAAAACMTATTKGNSLCSVHGQIVSVDRQPAPVSPSAQDVPRPSSADRFRSPASRGDRTPVKIGTFWYYVGRRGWHHPMRVASKDLSSRPSNRGRESDHEYGMSSSAPSIPETRAIQYLNGYTVLPWRYRLMPCDARDSSVSSIKADDVHDFSPSVGMSTAEHCAALAQSLRNRVFDSRVRKSISQQPQGDLLVNAWTPPQSGKRVQSRRLS